MPYLGRRLLKSELDSESNNYKEFFSEKTILQNGEKLVCQRCGSQFTKCQFTLLNDTSYCPFCIQMGRCQTDNFLYQKKISKPTNWFQPDALNWKGVLNSYQEAASNQIVEMIKVNGQLLIHGVTGAGKTEMLFKGLEYAFKQGLRVALAAPRVDVCLELYPRLLKVFPDISISLLYGKQKEGYQTSQLVICTTHQLLRFYQAFDVMIVDEIDAFPLAGNNVLAFAIKQSRKKISSQIVLTATVTKELSLELANEGYKTMIVPVRYHQKPLPVPELVWCWRWREKLLAKRFPSIVKEILEESREKQESYLIFCPSVEWLLKFHKQLVLQFPSVVIEKVYAKDPSREEKIQSFRGGEIDWLLTTTILERGVTFKGVNVIVVGANHRVYKTASLIQIAGRVGRSFEQPSGHVFFIHDGLTKPLVESIKVIQEMNAKGG